MFANIIFIKFYLFYPLILKILKHLGAIESKYITYTWLFGESMYCISPNIHLCKEKPYNQVTGVCRLCLFEAYFLMFDQTNCTLNSRAEYFSACPHKRKYLLKNS